MLCEDGENKKPKRVYYQSTKNSGFWVISNFEKHLRKVHSLKVIPSNKIKQKRIKKEALGEEDVEGGVQNHKDESSIDESHANNANSNSFDISIEQLQQSLENTNDYSLESVHVVTENSSTQTNEDMASRLYAQISQQMQQMVAAALINSESESLMEFVIKNQNKSLSLIETNKDGNCLFSALAHQLWPNHITSPTHKQNTKN